MDGCWFSFGYWVGAGGGCGEVKRGSRSSCRLRNSAVTIVVDLLAPTLVLAPNLSLLAKVNGVVLVGNSPPIPPKPAPSVVLAKPKLGPEGSSKAVFVVVGEGDDGGGDTWASDKASLICEKESSSSSLEEESSSSSEVEQAGL